MSGDKAAPQAPTPLAEFLSFAAAGTIVGLSPRTLRRLAAAGTLRPVRVPGLRGQRLRRADLAAWVASL